MALMSKNDLALKILEKENQASIDNLYEMERMLNEQMKNYEITKKQKDYRLNLFRNKVKSYLKELKKIKKRVVYESTDFC